MEDGDDPPSTEYHLNELPPPPAHPPLVASSGSASSSIGDTSFTSLGVVSVVLSHLYQKKHLTERHHQNFT